jgi:hypothetical protein
MQHMTCLWSLAANMQLVFAAAQVLYRGCASQHSQTTSSSSRCASAGVLTAATATPSCHHSPAHCQLMRQPVRRRPVELAWCADKSLGSLKDFVCRCRAAVRVWLLLPLHDLCAHAASTGSLPCVLTAASHIHVSFMQPRHERTLSNHHRSGCLTRVLSASSSQTLCTSTRMW